MPTAVSPAVLHSEEHSPAYRTRRFLNWFPLGLAYALLYMGRYNLTVAKTNLGELMSKEEFGTIFAIGTWVYGLSFLVNGPLTDRVGGRRSMLVSLAGSAAANLAMGFFIQGMLRSADPGAVNVSLWMSVLYAINMYFQSFAAVAIVKVNAAWFHLRERGAFSGIFGTMISSGIFFAYTGNQWILDTFKTGDTVPVWLVFFAPGGLLAASLLIEAMLLRDRPSEAGLADIDTGDGGDGRDEAPVPALQMIGKILRHPVLLTIACIEFCTGVLRQGIMQWVPVYAKEVWVLPPTHALMYGHWATAAELHLPGPSWVGILAVLGAAGLGATVLFVAARQTVGLKSRVLAISGLFCALSPFLQGGWGGLLFVAGVIGGNAAGFVSDLVFQSRRGPAAGGLYVGLTLGIAAMIFSLGGTKPEVGWIKDPAKTDLRPGDTFTEIAGITDLHDWNDVSRAFACVPATCVVPKRFENTGLSAPGWDGDACTCSSALVNDPAGAQSPGFIAAKVTRAGPNGQEAFTLAIKDQKATQTAGDRRTLPGGPALTVSPLPLVLISFLVSLCVIGSHGLLSGTATMDFGGRRSAATAVGVIDGFVYLGSGVQAWALGVLTTKDWGFWPMFLLPFGVAGSLLCVRIWDARPGRGGH
ncbi:MAG: MFS transporter [Myxococcales bacterium]|nr:MFS transporter [Myxococcales bacterium]